jgi:integrase
MCRTGFTAVPESLHLKSTRDALKPRREPYWGPPLDKGRHLGVRKTADGTCTWVARLRDDDGKRHYQKLGQATAAFDYHKAKRAAEEWFANFDVGVTEQVPTVAEACREYVADRKAEGRPQAAHDAHKRFERTVYPHPIANVRLDKLRTARLKEWRNGLGGAASSQNRNLNTLRAALNLAVAHNRVGASVAQQWKAVKPHKGADNRRTLYLDRDQRRALVDQAEGELRDFILAAMLTGARPGELASLRRRDFDHRTGTVQFAGKTGTRTVPLADDAVALFKRCAQGKTPDAPLLANGGKPWQRHQWDKGIRAAAKRANLPTGTVAYTLRHSWITEALMGGMSTLEVARLTGTSLAMIERHYGHLVAESARGRLASVEMV